MAGVIADQGGMTIPLRAHKPTSPLDEADIDRVVEAFYARVRADAMLGPIFDGAIHDWPGHLDNLKAFWSSVMFTSGRYKGRPMPAHIRHAAAITPAAFERWLALWGTTTDELAAPDPWPDCRCARPHHRDDGRSRLASGCPNCVSISTRPSTRNMP